jgi:hypothetical protein
MGYESLLLVGQYGGSLSDPFLHNGYDQSTD